MKSATTKTLVLTAACTASSILGAFRLAIAQEPLRQPLKVISTGKPVQLASEIAPDETTVFLFYKPGVLLEADFVKQMQRPPLRAVSLRLIQLKTGDEPAAKQHAVATTPTAIVMDRRRRVVGRSSLPDEIRGFVQKSQQVMRIDWAEDGTELLAQAEAAMGGKALKPGIMRTLSLQPEWLKHFNAMTRLGHFQDSALKRREKEMIATYVSGLNKCKF